MQSCQEASTTGSGGTSGSGSGQSGSLDLQVKSAGGADGNFAEFYVDGSLVELEAGRGLSVVVLDEDGLIVSKQVFDTGYQAEGAGPLVDLLQDLPDGTIVMMAAMDDASDSLSADAKAAIATLGATKIDEISYRGSYALIGVKGRAAIAELVAASGDGPLTIEENVALPLAPGLGAPPRKDTPQGHHLFSSLLWPAIVVVIQKVQRRSNYARAGARMLSPNLFGHVWSLLSDVWTGARKTNGFIFD
eukprot:Skav226540  [mRNA]  locus=scaffold421:25060:25800:+ [translate_table: standard]